jgi:glycosidase
MANKSLLSLLLASLFGCGASAQTKSLPDSHRSLSIYQIMVASFQHADDGASGYAAMWGPDGETKNGNLRGVIKAMDYISSLGVNAIWLTPIFDSSVAVGGEKLQATGYFTNNYFAVDPHFGTASDLHELVNEAHRRGIYVILDGVFGHHGGVVEPSPSGYTIDCTESGNDRNEGTGNVAYPGSLDYFKEVATWWIDNFEIDGWRLDQAYQACQGNHNYWLEIRDAVERTCAARRAQGKQWGTLGYMVGEDWGDAATINSGVYKNGGLLSAFDFDGKKRLSGAMQNVSSAGLENGWDDVIQTLRNPRQRGYCTDSVMPNLFLTNHDGYRLADHFELADPYYYEKQMTRMAVLAAYNGPITIYYGDEYADRTLETKGGQPDNVARTSGHLLPRNAEEKTLRDYLANALNVRKNNPAMWRGETSFTKTKVGDADVLIVYKKDTSTNNQVYIVFSDEDTTVPVQGYGAVDVDAWRPEILVVK